MSGWWSWIISWQRPVALSAWLTDTISWLWGSQRDNSVIVQDIERGHNSSSVIAEVGYENLSKEQIGPKTHGLENPVCTTCVTTPTKTTWQDCDVKPKTILEAASSGNLIGVGVFAHVHHLGGGRVRKVPAPDPDNLDLAIKSIRREGEIYDHLGDHPRVIKCLAKGDLFVDLEYAPCGHIKSYLKSHHDTSDECRIRFAQEVIEAVVSIHSKGIIHSDLAARQFLLDSTLHVNLSDFGFSSFGNGDVLGFENASHHLPRDIDSNMPSTIQSDLFALGSTIYEVMTGKPPYKGKSDDAIAQLYSNGTFPNVTEILCGHIIMGCWQGRFKSAAEVLDNFLTCSVTNM